MSTEFTFEPLSDEKKAERAKVWTGGATRMVDLAYVRPGNALMPEKYKDWAEKIKNFEVRDGDIFMVSYPKAGSTVTQEMLWQIVHDFDLEGGQEIVFTRVPFLEMSCLSSHKGGLIPSEKPDNPMELLKMFMADSVNFTNKMDSPRVIKTHVPLSMLPEDCFKKGKVVWMARNPKDSLISYFNHECTMPVHGMDKTKFDEYFKYYLAGEVFCGDYWNFWREMWPHKDHPNVKLIWFEDLRKDMRSVIKDIARFLGRDAFADNDEKVDALLDHLDIKNFRHNDAVNMKPPKGTVPDDVRDNFNFIGQGNVGGWKAKLDQAKIDEMNAWIEKNNAELKIPFKFE